MPRLTTQRGATIDERIVASLACGRTQAEAALVAGCTVRHVANRLKAAGFAARIDEARARIMGEAVGKLMAGLSGAIDTLVEVSKRGDTDSARVAAARAIVVQTMAVQSHAELARKVAELEERVSQRQPHHRGSRP